jgi:hypothetical protein
MVLQQMLEEVVEMLTELYKRSIQEGAPYRGQYVLAVSLNRSGAFDRIGFDSAARALEKHKGPNEIVTWLTPCYAYRKVTADLQCEQVTVRAGGGATFLTAS